MIKKTGLLMALLVATANLAAAIPNFSGDFVMKTSRGTERVAKIYYSEPNWRNEIRFEGTTMILIGKMDIKKMWSIMPNNRTYTESSLDISSTPAVTDRYPGEISRRKVGREAINGIMCDKFETKYRFNNATKTAYQWVSTDNKIAMKTADAGGEWSSEIRNLRVGPQPASLFSVPAGYRKIETPRIGY